MAEQALRGYSIGEGGLLRRIETAMHLTKLHWQIAFVLALTWIPMVGASLVEEYFGHPEPLVRDPSVHVRLLIATPLFLLLDYVFPRACERILQQLVSQSFVPSSEQPRFERMLRRDARLADSVVPEVVLAFVSIGLGVATLFGAVPLGVAFPKGVALTASQLWYAFTDLPLFQFLLWRSLWRWAVWVIILVDLSRLDLDLVPTHPDRRGGIAFLRLPSIGYCAVLLFAVGSVVCAEWGKRLTLEATIATFKPLLLLFAVVGAVLAFGPLLAFTPRLARLRREGIMEYDGLAADYGRRFRRRWLAPVKPERMLGNTEIGVLADVCMTYRDSVDRLRWVLFDRRDLLVLLVSTLLPIVPLMLAHISSEDWHGLLSLLTGGRI
jgi:hypothetical protein